MTNKYREALICLTAATVMTEEGGELEVWFESEDPDVIASVILETNLAVDLE